MSAPSRNVSFIKPQEPSFLKAFKARVGYKEPETIEAKRERVAPKGDGGGREEGSDEERDDELPTVVVLGKEDVDEEEFHQYRSSAKELKKSLKPAGEEADEPSSVSGPENAPGGDHAPDGEGEEKEGDKIVFKRPPKRRSSEGVLDASTKKSREEGGGSRGGGTRSRKRSNSSSAKVKNNSLLSFGDEEEDV